jgi:hypothetical protein
MGLTCMQVNVSVCQFAAGVSQGPTMSPVVQSKIVSKLLQSVLLCGCICAVARKSRSLLRLHIVDDILHIGVTIQDVFLYWYRCTTCNTLCLAQLCCHSMHTSPSCAEDNWQICLVQGALNQGIVTDVFKGRPFAVQTTANMQCVKLC